MFSLEAICEYCVGSAVLMTILLCLSLWRFLRGDEPQAPPESAAPGEQPPAPVSA